MTGVELRRLSRWHPSTLRAALWALRSVRALRRGRARWRTGRGLPAVPGVPDGARRGVLGVLARTDASCLVRAAVLRAWDGAHGHQRDLVIGVTAPDSDFRAHAWLDGDPPCASAGYAELIRVSARPAGSSTR